MIRRTGPKVHTTVVLETKSPKEEVGRESEDKVLEPVEVPPGHFVAVVKWSNSFRTSHSFQSFGIDVGVEFPIVCKPGDLDAVRAAFPKVEELVDETMIEKIREAPEIIKRLVALKEKVKS